jgi:hypothetical protein
MHRNRWQLAMNASILRNAVDRIDPAVTKTQCSAMQLPEQIGFVSQSQWFFVVPVIEADLLGARLPIANLVALIVYLSRHLVF